MSDYLNTEEKMRASLLGSFATGLVMLPGETKYLIHDDYDSIRTELAGQRVRQVRGRQVRCLRGRQVRMLACRA